MMFCKNCGKQSDDGAKFCQACGAAMGETVQKENEKIQVSISNEFETKVTPNNQNAGKSKPFVSDCGLWNPHISTAKKNSKIAAAVCFALWLLLAFIVQVRTYSFMGLFSYGISYGFGANSYIMIVFGIASVIWELWVGTFVSGKIAATSVDVYQDKVKGVAVDKDFSIIKLIYLCMGWDKARLANFDLTFDKITSVDLDGSYAIIINSSGANYRCFVSDSFKVQTAINNKIRNE